MSSSYDPATMIWSGPVYTPYVNPEASLGQALLSTLSLMPSKVVQINADTGRSMTAKEMRLRAIRAAQNLQDLGLRKGDVVALASGNSENVAPMVVGMLASGIAVNTLAPNFGVDDFAHMMKITEPKLVFCDPENYELVKKAVELSLKNSSMIYVFECDLENVKSADDLLKETGREHLFSAPYLGDSRKLPAFILCSSGTTGLPKAVCQSHAQMLSANGCRREVQDVDLFLNFSSLYWLSGVYNLVSSMLIGFTRLVTRRSFDAGLCLDLLQKYPVEAIYTPPSYANLLLQHPKVPAEWPKLKRWFFGGSFLSLKIRTSIALKLPNGLIFNTYGNSEIGVVSIDAPNNPIPHCVGLLVPNQQAKIVDEHGTTLGPNTQGELLVKHREAFIGYYNNPEATGQSFDAEGWFKTGDLAYFDDNSLLYVVDRKKELLKYRNYQIAPADLEAIVAEIDGVEQVCVVGVPDEDEASELATAVVVKTVGSKMTEQELLDAVNSRVADYKKLRGGDIFVKEIPLTMNGKVLKRAVRETLNMNRS